VDVVTQIPSLDPILYPINQYQTTNEASILPETTTDTVFPGNELVKESGGESDDNMSFLIIIISTAWVVVSFLAFWCWYRSKNKPKDLTSNPDIEILSFVQDQEKEIFKKAEYELINPNDQEETPIDNYGINDYIVDNKYIFGEASHSPRRLPELSEYYPDSPKRFPESFYIGTFDNYEKSYLYEKEGYVETGHVDIIE